MVIFKMGGFLQNMYFHQKGRWEVNKYVVKDKNVDTIIFLNCLKKNIPWSHYSTCKRKNCHVALKNMKALAPKEIIALRFPEFSRWSEIIKCLKAFRDKRDLLHFQGPLQSYNFMNTSLDAVILNKNCHKTKIHLIIIEIPFWAKNLLFY